MNETVFIDTSALYALINRKDKDHEKIQKFLADYKGRLFFTNYIFDEIITLVMGRLGHEMAVKIGNTLQVSPQIIKIWITPSDDKLAWELFVSRKDKSYSFTDCTSFIVMKRLKITKCLTFDSHFNQEGFEDVL